MISLKKIERVDNGISDIQTAAGLDEMITLYFPYVSGLA